MDDLMLNDIALYNFSTRQLMILKMFLQGRPQKSMCIQLGCSRRTVESEVETIKKILGVDSLNMITPKLYKLMTGRGTVSVLINGIDSLLSNKRHIGI